MNKYLIKLSSLLVCVAIVLTNWSLVYGFRDLPADNLAYPVLVIGDDSYASGFYVSHQDEQYFITAKHVLFQTPKVSQVEFNKLPDNIAFPLNISRKIGHDTERKRLIFAGIMSENDRDALLRLSDNKEWQKAVQSLYASAQYKLKAKNIYLLSPARDIQEEGRNLIELQVEQLNRQKLIRMHDTHDVVAILIGRLVKSGKPGEETDRNTARTIKFSDHVIVKSSTRSGIVGVNTADTIKRFRDVLIGNEVFIFGYPRSLGIQNHPQLQHERALLRKGIVAGKNPNFGTIVIDCPSYKGNSGGPVIEREQMNLTEHRYSLIGLVSQFIPYEQRWLNPNYGLENREWENSGYTVVVPVDMILELLPK
jgi:hypothetical protein